MTIISVEIMKTIDEREWQKTTREKQTKTERSRGDRSYSERVRAKWFFCAFKLGFLQLISKASLIFKSNFELTLSIIFKKRELYESKHVAVKCRCLKIWDLLSFLISSSILVLKWQQVSPIQLELQQAQVSLYTRKDFKSLRIGSTITLLKKLFQTLRNSKSSVKAQPLNAKLNYNVFYASWNKKTFLMKLNMIICILLVLLLLVSMVLLKCTNSPLVIHFLNFVWLFHL